MVNSVDYHVKILRNKPHLENLTRSLKHENDVMVSISS